MGCKAHPVHCVSCGWEGKRTQAPLKPCPKCGSHVVWTFTGWTKPKKPSAKMRRM